MRAPGEPVPQIEMDAARLAMRKAAYDGLAAGVKSGKVTALVKALQDAATARLPKVAKESAQRALVKLAPAELAKAQKDGSFGKLLRARE